ncbi:hypothetical protein [Streptomyces sp. NPDC020951]|uniref:hypothetical protein n=1 Tax=Streptomyces sp. NPDC020951 TaxID=3365104 RepID=UPI003788B4EF
MNDHVSAPATYAGTWLPESLLATPEVAEDVERFENLSRALHSFQSALETQNLQGLLDILAPDVVFVSDGGGLQQAAVRPVVGADKVVRYLAGRVGRADGTFTSEPTTVNGNPGLVLRVDGVIDGVLAFRVDNARVTGLYYVRHPERLTGRRVRNPLTSR